MTGGGGIGAEDHGAGHHGAGSRGAGGRGGREARAEGGSPPEAPGAITLADAQRAVDEWIGQFEEGYWPPLANLARLVEEVGELARELNHRHGSKPKKPDEPEADLALELADILFVLIALANEQGIDLDLALRRTLDKYRTRDADRWTPKEPQT